MKKVNLLVPKWWNPLFWLVVVLAPVLGIVGGTVAGAFYGMLIGYEKGVETVSDMLHKFIAELP